MKSHLPDPEFRATSTRRVSKLTRLQVDPQDQIDFLVKRYEDDRFGERAPFVLDRLRFLGFDVERLVA